MPSLCTAWRHIEHTHFAWLQVFPHKNLGNIMAGDWAPSRVVIFKWPNQSALEAFMSSEEYQPWKTLRESVTTTKTLVRVVGEGHVK